MSGGRGIPRRTLPAFNKALQDAWDDAHTPLPGEAPVPKPLCDGRSAEFVDYGVPPSAERAAELCAPCPLLDLCQASARHTKPWHGVWGGEVWVDRKIHVPAEPAREMLSEGARRNVDEAIALVD